MSLTQEITSSALKTMVSTHYDNPDLMGLEGEIHFDDQLSEAEVAMAEQALWEVTEQGFESQVYLPCAGTLRHITPLVRRGVRNLTAVDLSRVSLEEGVKRYGHEVTNHVAIFATDLRNVTQFTPTRGFRQAILLGNSFGDVTDLEGNEEFIGALSDSLSPGGALVFDYVGNRYNPPLGTKEESVWNDRMHGRDVLDRRTRTYNHMEAGIGRLEFTCQVSSPSGEIIVPHHRYEKLVIPDDKLELMFANAGMKLHPMGPVTDISLYHRRRVALQNDLGMMGKPNHLYVAVKNQ